MNRRTDLLIIAVVAILSAGILYGVLGNMRCDSMETMETRRIGVDYVTVQIPGELWERISRVSERMEISPEGLIRETLTEECEYQEEKDSTGWQD